MKSAKTTLKTRRNEPAFDADEAERALMEHLEAVQAAVEETRSRLGDRPLLSLLEEATTPAEVYEQEG